MYNFEDLSIKAQNKKEIIDTLFYSQWIKRRKMKQTLTVIKVLVCRPQV